MQLEQAVLFLKLISVVALTAFQRPVRQYMEFFEDPRLPRTADTVFHHCAVSAVADRPITVTWFHPARLRPCGRESDPICRARASVATSKIQRLDPKTPMFLRVAQALAGVFRALPAHVHPKRIVLVKLAHGRR